MSNSPLTNAVAALLGTPHLVTDTRGGYDDTGVSAGNPHLSPKVAEFLNDDYDEREDTDYRSYSDPDNPNSGAYGTTPLLLLCPKCSHQKHPAKFPINAKTGQRSPNCVDCPPHVGKLGVYVQSEPMSTVSEFGKREGSRI